MEHFGGKAQNFEANSGKPSLIPSSGSVVTIALLDCRSLVESSKKKKKPYGVKSPNPIKNRLELSP